MLSICLGGLFFTALQHATHAGWGVVLRRFAEAVAANLMWIWVLFIPVAGCMLWTDLYHWRHPEGDPILLGKAAFLNPTFWLALSFVFLAIWAMLARFFYNNSVAQDTSGDVSLTHRMQKWAPVAMVLYVVSQSYGVIAWMMSLEPHWFSTMYAVYFFAASCCGFFSVLIIVMYLIQRAGKLRDEITLEHYHDAGKLLFAFGIVFWAYIAFSQYMLIYYANIPEETGWYMTRQMGGWGGVSLLLLFGHFIIPFMILISRHPKRIKGVIAAIACWMLFMHFIDMYWLIKPMVPADIIANSKTYGEVAATVTDEQIGYGWTLLDLTCLVGLFGLFIAATARRLQQGSLMPEQDPRIHESLAFENV